MDNKVFHNKVDNNKVVHNKEVNNKEEIEEDFSTIFLRDPLKNGNHEWPDAWVIIIDETVVFINLC